MLHPDPTAFATDPAPTDPQAPARALIGRQLDMLSRLAEIGMGIAEDAGRRSTALAGGGAAETHAADPGLTYARAARAVRLTIALQSRLLGELAALDRAESAAHAARASTRRRRIHAIVERVIDAEHNGDGDEIERLSSDIWEHLNDKDDIDLTDRPLSEVVAAICADLGLSPDLSAQAVAACEGAAATPFPAPAAIGDDADPTSSAPAPPAPAPAAASPAPPGARPRAPPLD